MSKEAAHVSKEAAHVSKEAAHLFGSEILSPEERMNDGYETLHRHDAQQ